jgi:NADH-quinone oxidoreductase subunit E
MTFYGFFREEDRLLGKTRRWVCRSLACALRGGEEVLTTVCLKLGVRPGGTTQDGTITVEFAECLGQCEGAPAVLVNDEARTDVDPKHVDALIRELKGTVV